MPVSDLPTSDELRALWSALDPHYSGEEVATVAEERRATVGLLDADWCCAFE